MPLYAALYEIVFALTADRVALPATFLQLPSASQMLAAAPSSYLCIITLLKQIESDLPFAFHCGTA